MFRTEEISFPSKGAAIRGTLFIPEADRQIPAIVVCHGALDFKENYSELCAYLARSGIAALALDMHGHGASEGQRLHVDIGAWVEDIRGAIAYLDHCPKVNPSCIGVFGLSSGGTAVLEAALVEPRIKAVITLDATVRNTLSPLGYLGVMILTAIGHITRLITGEDLRVSMVGPFCNAQVACDPEVNRRWKENPKMLSMWAAFPFPGGVPSVVVDTITRVHRITVPTLVIHGGDDKVDPPETARALYAALTCAKRLCIIPGNGHLGHMDTNKGQVMKLIADWARAHLV